MNHPKREEVDALLKEVLPNIGKPPEFTVEEAEAVVRSFCKFPPDFSREELLLYGTPEVARRKRPKDKIERATRALRRLEDEFDFNWLYDHVDGFAERAEANLDPDD